MTRECSGSPPPGRSTSRSAAGMPSACSARHITGSQEIGLPRLTWAATQAAAARTSADVPGAAPAPVVGAGGRTVLLVHLSSRASDPATGSTSARATPTLKPPPRRGRFGGDASAGAEAGAALGGGASTFGGSGCGATSGGTGSGVTGFGGADCGGTGFGDSDFGGASFGGIVAGGGTGSHGGLSPGPGASLIVPSSCSPPGLACPFS